jgi:hypothetical protein
MNSPISSNPHYGPPPWPILDEPQQHDERSTICKHCRLALSKDRYGHWRHATGVQQGKARCGINPYGFLAEPEGTPCSDNPANPCNGARGIVPARRELT